VAAAWKDGPVANTADGRDRQTGGPDSGARWLIDGMNLIGSRPDRWWNDPDRAIRRLVEELDDYAAATGEDVTVVFDRRPADRPTRSEGAATVMFASWRGRNAADHEIVRIVGEDPSPETIRVVTADRRLIERVRDLGAAVTSPSSFRRRLDGTLE
jgi:predicted RNA-binding protein with PIN domain